MTAARAHVASADATQQKVSSARLRAREKKRTRAEGNSGRTYDFGRLTVGAPDDRMEREADRMADAALAPDPGTAAHPAGVLRSGGAAGIIRRLSRSQSPRQEDAEVVSGEEEKPAQEEEPVEESTVARKTRDAAQGAPRPDVSWAHRLEAAQAGGAPIDTAIADDMGARFGFDFGQVRIHRDSSADALADAIDARAFAFGNHLYFGAGEYRPDSKAGRRVLAHELAHVVQTGGGEDHHVRRMSVLDHTSQSNILRKDVAPWGPPDPRGNEYRVQTDGGADVAAWVAYSGYPEADQYWCHGYSFGTYARWSYSVWSGDPMRQVLNDEYAQVDRANARSGDIAVWVPSFAHSCVFDNVVAGSGGVDEMQTTMRSKNGNASLKTATLRQIQEDYADLGASYQVYRHR